MSESMAGMGTFTDEIFLGRRAPRAARAEVFDYLVAMSMIRFDVSDGVALVTMDNSPRWRRTWGPAVLLAALLQSPIPAISADLPTTSPAAIVGASQFDLASQATGRTYRINLAVPDAPPPAAGYPIIYVLDADFAFATAVAQVRLGAMIGKPGAIVVGIGYPDATRTMMLRNRDFTATRPDRASLGAMAAMLGTSDPDAFGGADAFNRFIAHELKPRIERALTVDRADQTLVGYSLGGLFTLHVLFTHPDAFRTFVAGSPSIWWNGREVLKDVPAFADAVRAGRVAPRILITANEWEQSETSPDLPRDLAARAAMLSLMRSSSMVDDARALAARLSSLKGAPGYVVDTFIFPKESHFSGYPAATGRAVSFALSR